MNYYFLLEDVKSFPKILPIWLEFMDFGCTRVEKIKDIVKNNYLLQSGKGIVQLETNVIFNTIDTIIDNPNVIDKLVIIVDAEDVGFTERKERIFDKITKKYSLDEIPCTIEIFVCNRCLETWLLGCKGISLCKTEDIPQQLLNHYNFYDIENKNPELMGRPTEFTDTVASYHFRYLHDLLLHISIKEHKRILSYRKSNPGCVICRDYFEAMVKRIKTTEDIASFKEFYNFIISERVNNV